MLQYAAQKITLTDKELAEHFSREFQVRNFHLFLCKTIGVFIIFKTYFPL